ncbi:uncharacterized protein N7515_002689 [Penicillium bovifimosum]|uniref:Uncharacterized protein n=1 Tax=Penicillium bovifimosum TaxID=126998 RepID=A0A9W9HC55_9EURO|nr:uncharacterized protein N7515_002689 [Penicillium bovifimosum]KAJ5143902.1 hypothetical protein N7515_002689 [Penicillium bovifimosum]
MFGSVTWYMCAIGRTETTGLPIGATGHAPRIFDPLPALESLPLLTEIWPLTLRPHGHDHESSFGLHDLTSVWALPPMDLTSVRGGTIVKDIVVDHCPSTGRRPRGKPLTPAQEGLLRELFEQELLFVPKGSQPLKPFWVNLASRFREHSGQEYSWLSVKRRAAGWHQGSPENERPVDVSRASLNRGESPVTENKSEAAVRDPPKSQVQSGIPRRALAQNGSSQPQDPVNLDRPEPLRGPGVPDEMQPSHFSSAKALNSVTKSKSHRKSRSPDRSRSPDHVSRHRYRHRSPPAKRHTMRVALTKHYRLASASHKAAPSGLKPASDASAGLNHASTPNFAGLDHIRDSSGEDDAGNLLRDSTRSPPKEDSISDNLLEISDLSDTDDLPATPVSIPRRDAVLKKW